MKNLADIRSDYQHAILDESHMLSGPLEQFDKWFREALEAEVREVNAMSLATATLEGRPSNRIVLLKGLDETGFVFFTNYHSDKGQMLAANPYAAMTFFWPELERQVRIEGRVEKVGSEESDVYFSKRPWGSRIAALTSEQSTVITHREDLETRYNELADHYRDKDPIRPPHWGGYRLLPESVEFWQGRSNRLHDRLKYIKSGEGWRLVRLAP